LLIPQFLALHLLQGQKRVVKVAYSCKEREWGGWASEETNATAAAATTPATTVVVACVATTSTKQGCRRVTSTA